MKDHVQHKSITLPCVCFELNRGWVLWHHAISIHNLAFRVETIVQLPVVSRSNSNSNSLLVADRATFSFWQHRLPPHRIGSHAETLAQITYRDAFKSATCRTDPSSTPITSLKIRSHAQTPGIGCKRHRRRWVQCISLTHLPCTGCDLIGAGFSI